VVFSAAISLCYERAPKDAAFAARSPSKGLFFLITFYYSTFYFSFSFSYLRTDSHIPSRSVCLA
jgi:hypothetical protein